LRRERQRLTWCEADREGETFDVARLLYSGQPAGSYPITKKNMQREVKTINMPWIDSKITQDNILLINYSHLTLFYGKGIWLI